MEATTGFVSELNAFCNRVFPKIGTFNGFKGLDNLGNIGNSGGNNGNGGKIGNGCKIGNGGKIGGKKGNIGKSGGINGNKGNFGIFGVRNDLGDLRDNDVFTLNNFGSNSFSCDGLVGTFGRNAGTASFGMPEFMLIETGALRFIFLMISGLECLLLSPAKRPRLTPFVSFIWKPNIINLLKFAIKTKISV